MDERPLFGTPRVVIRRHRTLVGALGTVGLCVGLLFGIAYSALNPSLPYATAQVVVPAATSSSSSSSANMTTQILIATSLGTLAAAARSVSPPTTAAQLGKETTVTAVGPDILSIRVKASDAAQAVALTNAVTIAYVRFVHQLSGAVAGGPGVLQRATPTTHRSVLITPIDAVGGLVAGLAIGWVTLRKGRREWRSVQLI